MDKEIKKKLASNWFKLLQNIICDDIEKIENKKIKFKSKTWNRSKIKDEGGGEFRIFKNGKVFEKVGVNFSEVYGKFSKEMVGKIPGANKNPNFWASGISVVMHMNNPYIPAIHFNTRFIYTTHGWFGGGMDVTPCIVDNKEKTLLHKELKKMCDRHNKKYYKKYKKWCDEYFYLPHRKETRGIGGIFFDYKKDNWEKDFKFVSDLGVTFQMLFNLIIKSKYQKKWTMKEK
jgi:coproporphyrinogen III oxidase